MTNDESMTKWRRLVESLGEGTFHQVHGGAATGLSKPALREIAGSLYIRAIK